MKSTSDRTSAIFKEDGLDFILLTNLYWKKRFLILKVLSVFFILGLFLAIFAKNTYESSTILVPQTGGSSKVGGSLGGLAAIAGINLGGLSGGNDISPILYPKIFNGLAFRNELLKTELSIEDIQKPISFKEYYLNFYDGGILPLFKKYTLGLPGTILNALKNKEKSSQISTSKYDSLPRISSETRRLMEILANQTSIDVNDKEGYITISSIMPEPLAAAQLTDNAKRILQDVIIEFQIEKAKTQLIYLEKRLSEKKDEFVKAQINLANYKDRNLFNSTARSITELSKLQSEYDLAFSVYSEIAQQVEAQRLQVKRDTPVFTVIQPPVVPDQKSGPSRIGILLSCLLMGTILVLLWIFLRVYFNHLKVSRIQDLKN